MFACMGRLATAKFPRYGSLVLCFSGPAASVRTSDTTLVCNASWAATRLAALCEHYDSDSQATRLSERPEGLASPTCDARALSHTPVSQIYLAHNRVQRTDL